MAALLPCVEVGPRGQAAGAVVAALAEDSAQQARHGEDDAPDTTVEAVRKATGAELIVREPVKTMEL